MNRTQSPDFTKAVGLLNTAQQMSMDMQCDYANSNLQQKDPTTCQVFKGKAASCKIVGGPINLVDCCETPSGSMGLGQYILETGNDSYRFKQRKKAVENQ